MLNAFVAATALHFLDEFRIMTSEGDT
jgi:hypothetical protein